MTSFGVIMNYIAINILLHVHKHNVLLVTMIVYKIQLWIICVTAWLKFGYNGVTAPGLMVLASCNMTIINFRRSKDVWCDDIKICNFPTCHEKLLDCVPRCANRRQLFLIVHNINGY